MRILLADDDRNIRNGLALLFKKHGFECQTAENGKAALDIAQHFQPDLYVLDITMPYIDGVQLCAELRARDLYQPILLLTAYDNAEVQVKGFDLGADDYLAKPFNPETLIARIKALHRRSSYAEKHHKTKIQGPDQDFSLGEIAVKPSHLQACFQHNEVSLTTRELTFLQLLSTSKGQVLDKNQILDCCWGRHYIPESRALDQFISTLRNKLEKKLQAPRIISTVHGVGYRLS